jgi:hypothetical protein
VLHDDIQAAMRWHRKEPPHTALTPNEAFVCVSLCFRLLYRRLNRNSEGRLLVRVTMQRILSMWWVILILSVGTMFAAVGPIRDLKITKAQYDLMALQTALDIYKTQRGSLPSEQDGLGALVGVTLSRIAVDPWGNPYVYRRTGQSDAYRVYSRGLDGRDDDGAGDGVTTEEKVYRCVDYGVNCPPTPRDLVVWSALFFAASSLIIGLVRLIQIPWRWYVSRL